MASDISVLMLSRDPGFIDNRMGSGDVVARHVRYAARVNALHIIVLGGTHAEEKKVSDRLTVYATGKKGLGNILAVRKLAHDILRRHTIDLIVTQEPHLAGRVGLSLKRKYHIPLLVH